MKSLGLTFSSWSPATYLTLYSISTTLVQSSTPPFGTQQHHLVKRQADVLSETPEATAAPCRDIFSTCSQYADKFCEHSNQTLSGNYRNNCQKTCGVCVDPADVEAEKEASLTGSPEEPNEETGETETTDRQCRDLMDCSIMKTFCDNPKYTNTRYYCRKSCNACGEEVATTTMVPPLLASSAPPLLGPVQVEPEEICQDRDNNCKLYGQYCALPEWRTQLSRQCPQTCGTCEDRPTLAPTLPPINIGKNPDGTYIVETRADCKDTLITACAASANLCNQDVYRRNCPKTCGACVLPEGHEEMASCDDISSNCDAMKEWCQKPGFQKNMQMMCAKTCGFECVTKSELMSQWGMTAPPVPQATQPTLAPTMAPTQPPGPVSGCIDNSPKCTAMASLCKTGAYVDRIVKICPKTCGTCPDEAAPTEEVGPAVCKDIGPGCPALAYMCTDEASGPLMHKNCPMTCGLCEGDGGAPVVVLECKDRIPKCTGMQAYCGKPGTEYMDKLCPVTCNKCPDPAAVTPASTVLVSSIVVTLATEATVPVTEATKPPTTVKTVAATEATQPSTEAPKSSTEADSSCVDKAPEKCTKQLCSMPGPKKKAFVKENCHKTCGLCGKSQPAATCADLKPNACKNYYRTKCNHAPSAEFVNLNCRKTCNRCASTPATEGALPTCADKKPKLCQQYGQAKCAKRAYKSYMSKNCKKLCGRCGGGSPVTAKPSGGGTCRDKTPKCKQYGKRRCEFKRYKPIMSVKCKATCGLCGGADTGALPVKPSPSGGCADKKPKLCKQLTNRRCGFKKYKANMATNCKKTCGLCSSRKRREILTLTELF